MVNDEEVFEYLDNLRDSGVTNMFGASMYLEEWFGFSREIARDYLIRWMESYHERDIRKKQRVS